MNSGIEKPIIFIAEPLPGGGASTVSKNLELLLNLEKVSVGQVRRSIALFWQSFRAQNEHLTESEAWKSFEDLFVAAMENESPAKVFLHLLGPFLDQFCDTPTLLELTRVQNTYSPMETVWDQIPDILAYTRLQQDTEKAGFVVDAKIGLRYQEILGEQYGELRKNIDRILPIWLQVSVYNSAERVAKRDIENRKLRMEGVEQDTLIKWLSNRDVVEPTVSEEILAWYRSEVSDLIGINLGRIAEDLHRYQIAYKHTPTISLPYLEDTPNLEIIDANQGVEQVLLSVLRVIADKIPSLIPANIQEIIDLGDTEALKIVLEDMGKRQRA